MKKYKIARKKGLKQSRKHNNIFVMRVGRGMDALNAKAKRKLKSSVFDAYDADHAHMANQAAVNLLSQLTIDQLVNHFISIQNDETVRHFFGTFCFDDGIAHVEGYFDINVEKLKKKTDKAIREAGLNAICVLQADVLKKNKDHRYDRLLVHFHAVCWTSDGKFKNRKAAKRLSGLPSFKNSFGAPSVTLVSRKDSAAKWHNGNKHNRKTPARFGLPEQDQNAHSMAHLGFYMISMPAYAKNLVPAKGKRKSYLRSTDKNYSCKLALKAVEFLQTIKITDAVFGVGEGASVSRAIKKGLREKM